MKKSTLLLLIFMSILMVVGIIYYQKEIDNSIETTIEKPITLTVLAGQSTSDAGIEDMIDEVIAKKFPHIQLEWECVDWGEKFDSQMYARFAAGDIPDIMIGKAQDIHTYVPSGNLAPISNTLSDKIKESSIEAVSIDKIVYGIPYNELYQGVIYNKDIFEKYELQPPTTLNGLQEIVSILSRENITPFAAHFQESWNVGNMTMQFFMNDIFKETPNWGEKFRAADVNFTGNNKIKHCLEQNKYIENHSWSDAMVIDQYESTMRFIEGEAAMYLTGSWTVQFINQFGASNNYGIFPYPNQSGDASLIRETNMTFMKSTTSNYGEIIDQIFEEIITNEDLIRNIMEFTQTYSTMKDMKDTNQNYIDEDIDSFVKKQQIVEVTAGNNQLIWTFQNSLASKQQEWIRGDLKLDDVLIYADEHRNESGN